MATSFVASIAVFVFLLSLSSALPEEGVCTKPDPGSMSSCFNNDSQVIGMTTLDMRWEPQHITENENYTVTVLILNGPKDIAWDKGKVHVTVWIPGLAPKPLYDKSMDYSCKELLELVPEKYKFFLNCPLKIPSLKDFKIPLTAPKEIPVPMGSYHIRLEVFNGEDETKEAFVCIDGWLIFAEVQKQDCVNENPVGATPQPSDELKFEPVVNEDSNNGHDML